MELSEVPLGVLKSVSAKWHNALKTGWNGTQWRRCDMCRFVGGCDDCPLASPGYCRGMPRISKLHPRYRRFGFIKSKVGWPNRVEEFLSWIDAEIERRT